ncbi:MAG: CHAT domain-containing protein [Dolichospermum sp. OL03]|nr:CHAT domain-containing protein [Dolichospermum sp. OL01]MCO5799835.1 CHAT domain-containing protein [Dolichospermum sp. OL03]MCS6282563.1 CHAT domain-containing protein [Dolichospermum sp.]
MLLQKIFLRTGKKILPLLALLILGFELPLLASQSIQNSNSHTPNFQILAQTPTTLKAEAERLLKLCQADLNQNQPEAAIQSCKQAVKAYQQIKDRSGEAKSSVNLGIAYDRTNQVEQAISILQSAVELARTAKEQRVEAIALDSLGSLIYKNYQALGKLQEEQEQKFIEYQQQTLKIYQNLDDRNMQAFALLQIGQAYLRIHDRQKASEYENQALVLFKDVGNKELEVIVMEELIKAYRGLYEHQKVLDLSNQLLEFYQKTGKTDNAISSLASIARSYFAMNEYQKAIDYYKQVIDLSRKTNNSELGNSLNQLGDIYSLLDQYDKARAFYIQSMEIAVKTNNQISKAFSLNNIGLLAFYQDKNLEAIDYYNQALKIFKENEKSGYIFMQANVLMRLGLAYQNLEKYQEAIKFFNQSIELSRKEKNLKTESDCLLNLGNIYFSQMQYPKAIEMYEKSLQIDRQTGDRYGESLSLQMMGQVLFNTQRLVEAEKIFLSAIEIRESLTEKFHDNLNKVSFFDKQTYAYDLLQQIYIAQNKIDKAIEAAERGRSRAFTELLTKNISTKQFKNLNIAPTKINFTEIQQVAQTQNATLVEYSLFNNKKLLIWVIQPTGKITLRQINLDSLNISDLKELIINSRQSIGVRGKSIEIVSLDAPNQTQQLSKLYQLLIEPIASLLPTDPNAHVIFMPQGELFLVPFSALQDDSGKYLIEKHTILTAPSIKVLDLTQQQRAEVQQANLKGLVIVGNPTMPKVTVKIDELPQQLPPLPATEKEAISIANLLHTKALIGKQATKTAIIPKLSQARIIHLATHGLLDDFKGLGVPGAIALAPSGNVQENDGLLTANEILNLKLNAELVVLSACDTGRGRITGDGVIGLSRSLIAAGTPSVIVSLWSVPDAPTAKLMIEFYRNWQQRKLDKAQALRQAMLTTMKQHPNPKDWAAFTLIGEAK